MTGGLTNNPIELLITLGVNTVTSKDNINGYINTLKTQLGKLDIDVTFNNKNSNFAKGIITELDDVQKKAKQTEQTISGMGKGPKDNTPRIFAGYKDAVIETMTSLEQLKSYLNKQNYKFDIKMGIDKNGEAYVKKVIADLKNDKGQIETMHIKPVMDQNGVARFEQFSKGLKDVSTYKLQEEINKAKIVLEDFQKRGKLTAAEYKEFLKVFNTAPNIKTITTALDDLKSREKNAVFGDKIGEALHNAGLKADELKNKMDRLERTNGSNASAKRLAELRKEIERILKMPINTIDDSKIVNKKLAEVEKKIGYASMSATDTKKFNDTLKKARDEIAKINETGILAGDSIRKMYDRLKNVPIGNIDQLNKEFKKLENSTKYFTEKKFVIDGIRQNTLNVMDLNAQLERSANLNRKYINTANYNKLQGEISALGAVQARNRTQVTATIETYQRLRRQVSAFNSEATQASRNSMTVMNAFKVAMERFPIWIKSPVQYKLSNSVKTLPYF